MTQGSTPTVPPHLALISPMDSQPALKLATVIAALMTALGVGHTYDRTEVGHTYDRTEVGHTYDRTEVGHTYDRTEVGHTYDRTEVATEPLLLMHDLPGSGNSWMECKGSAVVSLEVASIKEAFGTRALWLAMLSPLSRVTLFKYDLIA